MVKNPHANTGDTGSIPGLGGSPGEGNGKPLQYSCLGNPVDRGAWRATVHGVARDLLTVNSSAILGLWGFNQFSFSFLQLPPEACTKATGFCLRERQGCHSGATASLVAKKKENTDMFHIEYICIYV